MTLVGIPEKFELVYREEQISEALDRLSATIGAWVAEVQAQTGQDVVCIPVMRGGLFFAADLMRKLGHSVEVCPITTSSYSSVLNGTPHLQVKVDISSMDVKDKALLMIDDICDSGRTLAVLSEKLVLAGANDVRGVVLIQRKLENIVYQPNYVGFEYEGPEWFVGYGMEDAGRWRNLSAVYKIKVGTE